MSVYPAQMRKDLGVAWPLLTLWIGGLLLLSVLYSGPLAGLEMGFLYLVTVFEVLPVLITAFIVLQEPLSDTDAFWRTRPLPVRALLGSKLTLIALLVIAPAVALQALAYLTLDLPEPGLAPVITQTSSWLLTLVLFAWLLAAVSRSLPTFVTWLVAAFLATNFGLILILAPLHRAIPSLEFRPGPEMTVIGIAIGLLAIYWRYRTRRLTAFLPLAITAFLLLQTGPYASEWHGSTIDYTPEGNFELTRNERPTNSGPSVDYVNVGAKLVPPHSEEAVPILYEAQVALKFSDGRVFEGAPRIETRYSSEGARASSFAPLARPVHSMPTLLSIPAADFAAYAEQRGQLTLHLNGQWRSTISGDVPASVGETWTNRNGRYSVRELRLESTQVVLVVDVLRIGQQADSNLDVLIYNPDRREILRGGTQSSGHDGHSGRALVLSRPPSGTNVHELIHTYDAQRPHSSRTADGYRFFAGPIDTAWLEGARLRLNASPSLGSIDEVITIEDFRIVDWL